MDDASRAQRLACSPQVAVSRNNGVVSAQLPIWESDVCAQCGGALQAGAMLLCRREDPDGRRNVCRIELPCTDCDTIFWRWADRPDEAMEEMPEEIARWRRRDLADRLAKKDEA